MKQHSIQCGFSFFTVSTLNFLLFVISLVGIASSMVCAVPAYCKLEQLRNQSSCSLIHSVCTTCIRIKCLILKERVYVKDPLKQNFRITYVFHVSIFYFKDEAVCYLPDLCFLKAFAF